MNDSELILNPKSNRFVKKTSQTGLRLIKELSMSSEPIPIAPTPPPLPPPPPVQTALLSTCAEIVADNTPKFKNLTA